MEREFMILTLRILKVILWRMIYKEEAKKEGIKEGHKHLIEQAASLIHRVQGEK